MSEFTDINKRILPLALAGFVIFNSIGEELMFRGIFWDGLEKIFSDLKIIVILQALFFGLCHYQGFPCGYIGVVLAGIYGIFLGLLRIQAKGLLAPIVAHIFADLVIIVIILKSASMV